MGWLQEPCKDLKIRDENELWAICPKCKAHIERYQLAVQAEGWKIIKETDKQFEELKHKTNATAIRMQEKANEKIAAMVREKTDDLLDKVLRERSNQMKNAYARADA